MPQFLFVYHGGKKPDTPEEGAEVMAAWQSWFEGMGSAVVQPGNPVGMSKTVTEKGVADDGGANPTSGYTIISVSDIDAATKMAKACPILDGGSGSVEVAEIIEM